MHEESPRRLARIAGALYLVVIVGGFFAIGYVPGAIVVSGDPAATAHNISTHETLYRWGLVAHLIVLLCNVPLAVIFYELFKVVSRRVSLLVVFFTLVGTAVEGANLINQFAPLTLLDGGVYSGALTAQQPQALVYLQLDSQAISYHVIQVFFSLYIVSAAYLIFRATFFPSALGVLLGIGGVSYLISSFASFVSPGFAALLLPYILIPGGVGEVSLCLWLLIAGVNVQRWKDQAAAATELGIHAPRRASA